MSSNILRPAAGVSTPAPGAANPNNPNAAVNNAQRDPLAQMRGLIEQSNQATGGTGGIGWEKYGNNRYEDQALRDLRNESTVEQDSDQFYLQKYSQATADFLQGMLLRRGVYYDEYRQVLENYRLHAKMRSPCHIRHEFVNTINKHSDMVVSIAKAAAPMYCQRLIALAKGKNGEELTRNDYISSVHWSLRAVLTMEMVAWLCKSTEGQQFAFGLTVEIKEMISNLEGYKDAFGLACSTFGVSNPYANLVYEVVSPSTVENRHLVDQRAAFMYNSFGNNAQPVNDRGAQTDLDLLIQRNASRSQGTSESSGFYGGSKPRHQQEEHNAWGQERNDYQNMRPDNRKNYDYHKLFRPIDNRNRYLVSESDWKKIKSAFNRHADQPSQEETVLPGCFRVVTIDLTEDNGWFSTVVRGEGLDMSTVWTSPELLLPLLEGVDGTSDVTIKAVTVEEALGKGSKTLEIPLDYCETLDAIPVISVKEQLVATSSMKLASSWSSTNKALTKRIKGVNATSFNTTIWETYTCEDKEEKELLLEEFPFLFKDVEDIGEATFYQRVRRLNKKLEDVDITEELRGYIDERLTDMVNDWFVSSLGYDKEESSSNHLSIGSVVEAIDDLLEDFKENDEEAYRAINRPGGSDNYLTEQMKFFSVDNKYDPPKKNESIIKQTQRQLEMTMDRDFHVTVINNKPGPIPASNAEPVTIKRSKFSDYFDLVEKGFDKTMPTKDIRVVDKIVQFADSDNMWLFSYTSVDRNVATLRLIGRNRSLLYINLV